MIKNKAVVEIELNNRIYTMECPSDAPLGEVHDALCMMKSVLVNRINEIDKLENEKKLDTCCDSECVSKVCEA